MHIMFNPRALDPLIVTVGGMLEDITRFGGV